MFDEADRLLTDESFEPDLKFIMDKLPAQESTRDMQGRGRQTLLFSATMASEYDRHLSKELLYGKAFNPKQINACGSTTTDNDDAFTLTVKGL